YERNGLLPPAVRRPSGYREYHDADVQRLRFIRRAKDLGFRLGEINELLSLSAERGGDMRGVKRRAEQRLEQVEGRIQVLQRVSRGLQQLTTACPSRDKLTGCPTVTTHSRADDGERPKRTAANRHATPRLPLRTEWIPPQPRAARNRWSRIP